MDVQTLYDFIPCIFQGASRTLITYPFDVLKTQIQTEKLKGTLFQAVKELGFKNLYRGVSFPLIGSSFEMSLNYYLFENFLKYTNSFISAASAGLMTCSISIPVSYVTTNIMAGKRFYEIDLKQIYRGSSLILARTTFASTLYLGSYGKVRQTEWGKKYPFFAGGTVALFYWMILYPVDTVRVLKQVENKSYIDSILLGPKRLYRGISLVLLRTFPSSGVSIWMYESVRNKIKNLKEN